MLMEIFLIFEIVMVVIFFVAFFTKQEILWALTAVLSAILMFSSYNVQYYIYEINVTLSAYQPVFTSHSYPYLMGINFIFFMLSVILGIFDLFDKYGSKFAGNPGIK